MELFDVEMESQPAGEIKEETMPTQDDAKNAETDEFDDDDFDFDELALASQTQTERELSSADFKGRGTVVELWGTEHVIVEKANGEFFKVKTDPDWYLQVNDVVHGPPDFGSVIVAHSDNLISSTNVATAAKCPREAVLGDRFRDAEYGSRGSVRMLIGTILHEVFQELLTESIKGRIITVEKITNEFKKIAANFVEDIMLAGSDVDAVVKESECYFPMISSLLKGLCQTGFDTKLQFASTSNPNRTDHEDSKIKIEAVPDIEENLWEPRLGIKGKIDITAKIDAMNLGNGKRKKLVTPIELKSGRGDQLIQEHRIQTQLYGAVHAIRGNQQYQKTTGLVCYIKTGKVFSVPVKKIEIDTIMERRNVVAGYLRRPLKEEDEEYRALPPLIPDGRRCEFCFKRSLCSFWSKVEGLTHEDAKTQEVFEKEQEHVSPELLKYVTKWTRLGLLEQKNINRKLRGKEIWNNKEDEKSMLKGLESHGPPVRSGNRWKTLFKLPFTKNWPFDLGQSVYFSHGERLAVASGWVTRLNPSKGLKSRGIVELSLNQCLPQQKDYQVNLGKGAGGGNFDTTLWLGNLMLYASPYGERLQKILLNPPEFRKSVKQNFPETYDFARETLKKALTGRLNVHQKKAIKLALEAKSFSLIQGFPGSGKTSVIIELIRILLAFGKRVLITSHTHSAVDNILTRLLPKMSKQQVRETIRIGADKKIDITLHHISEETRLANCATNEDYQNVYEKARLVAGTCMGVPRHAVFTGGPVDYAIVDEAGQVSEPIVLGALVHSAKFILVGDPCQLPPLIHSRSAKQNGAQISLMERLSKLYPDSLRQLQIQYRFNSDITALANHLIYDGRMLSSEKNADQTLLSVHKDWKFSESQVWLNDAIDPSKTITFIDTSAKQGLENKIEGRGYTNPTEVDIVKFLVKRLNVMKVKKDCIGIIGNLSF